MKFLFSTGMAFGEEIHEAAAILLSRVADVSATDQLGLTPLHLVGGTEDKELALLLISKGARSLLIARGAQRDAREKQSGLTPLHAAAFNGYDEVAALLISRGAQVNQKNRAGQTPLDSAKGHKEMIGLLRKAGAKN